MKVVVLVAACTVACKFPELPALNGDASGSSDGQMSSDAPSDGFSGPNVEITSGPAANSMTGPRVTFEFTVQDGTPYCRFDNDPLTPCTSPLTVNLPAGPHTFHVQAENSGGTVDADSRLWTIECAPRQATNDTFGLYHMDEGSGTTAANEHPYQPFPAPEGNIRFEQAPYDPSWTTNGRFGSALHFTAHELNVTDRILATVLEPTYSMSLGAHSIEMWANPVPTLSHDLLLFSTSGGNQTGHMDYSLKFRKNGAQGTFILQARSENNSMSVTSQPVAVGEYHYVAISFAPGTPGLLFVDGQTFMTQPLQGTVDDFHFDGLPIYEGDVDELHLTFHRYTEQELLEHWCPL